jgi:hypothetical protein
MQLYEYSNHRSGDYEGSFAKVNEEFLQKHPGYRPLTGLVPRQRTTTCPLCRKASGSVAGHRTTNSRYVSTERPSESGP